MAFGPFLGAIGAGSKTLRSHRMERQDRDAENAAREQQTLDRRISLDNIRQQREKEALDLELRLRNSGYVPEGESAGDTGISGKTLDEIVGAASGIPTVGMQDVGPRYGSGPKGYKFDRQSPKALEDAIQLRQKRESLNPKPAASRKQVVDGQVVDLDNGTAQPIQGFSRAPKPPSEAQEAATQAKRLQTSRDLRNDYMKDPAVQNASSLAGVVRGLKAGLEGNTPMDDLSIIYETVKMFDPESVVREGEIKLFRTAASLPLQLRLMVDRWNSGRLLTPGMRAHISALLDRKVNEARTGMESVQSQFGATARDYGVESDSSFIAPDQLRGITAAKRSRLPNQE